MKLTRSRTLYALGGILFAALLVCSRSPAGTAPPSFLIALAVAGVAYLVAVREFFHTQGYPRHVILVCFALAALWRVPFLLKPPALEDDVRRYVWDGRMQRLGYNPYDVIPADPALAALHTDETRGLNNPDVPSPYPAGAQLFFRGITTIRESTFAFKVAFVACDLTIVLVLLDVLRRAGQSEHWVLAYAWHPLLVIEVAANGHIDILGVLLLLASIAALVVAMLYVPFLERGRIPIGSLGIFIERFRFNDPIFATLERVASLYVAVGLAVLAGVVTAVWLRSRYASGSPGSAGAPDGWVWPMAASLVCAPVIYPWYLLWVLPFLRFLPALPLIVWSVTIFSTYFVWHLHALGHPWQVPLWITALEYTPVAVAAAFILLRRSATHGRLVAEPD